jgi:hypothetical protein
MWKLFLSARREIYFMDTGKGLCADIFGMGDSFWDLKLSFY